MNLNVLGEFEKVVNDDNGVMIADLSATYSNGLHNISMVINTIDSYQQNKDTIIAALDEFLSDIQTASINTQNFVDSQNSQADTSTSSAASSASLSTTDQAPSNSGGD
ncbi:hypothetical protein ATX84_09330 [Oenococcus oeni]|uniref:hypothetical protein n=1 Tax=Oenococcus oeni TaxID=1247 RepID=UPI0008F8CBB7|nr:hypothetical protein [Oenococcus oeni]OIL04940.1 hypothetical protein ATW89_04100 [Oenococcus oeni]OIL09753.1 hypothetical protein ATW91_04290 [Oenococcus oeni]OIM50862.1 hypothetical protein ATX79_09340 [Oenococcus oeni]OIM58694.1 hypothetical protein ATX84_09330 [Oenococcus oeni]